MGRIVVTEFVSLDGVMEDPGGCRRHPARRVDIPFRPGDEGGPFKLDELLGAEALLSVGSPTAFAQAWPTIEDPVGFADKMNAMPKYVVSDDPADDDADLEQLHGAPGRRRARDHALKGRVGGDLLVRAAPRWCSRCWSTRSSTSSG